MSRKSYSAIDQGEIKATRLETLTDGIFAIAMTLLVLEIHIPEQVTSGHALLGELQEVWPTFLSFVISFVVLGMFWIGHHTEFRYIRRVDHRLIWHNIFFLLFVSLLPFSAGLLGQYPSFIPSIIIYGCNLIMMVLIQYMMWRHAKAHDLADPTMDPNINVVANRMGYFAIVSYVVALAVSLIDWRVSLLIYGIVPIPYVFGYFYRIPTAKQ